MVVRERAEALERQRLAEYIVWRKREGFQEKRDREKGGKSAEKENGAGPEVIWKRRGEVEEEGDAGRERARAIQRGHDIIWRKKERE